MEQIHTARLDCRPVWGGACLVVVHPSAATHAALLLLLLLLLCESTPEMSTREYTSIGSFQGLMQVNDLGC